MWTLPQYLRHHDFVFVYHVWIHHPHEYANAVSNCQLLAGDDILVLFKEQYPSKQKVGVRLLSAISQVYDVADFKNIRFQSSTQIRQTRRIQKQKSTLGSNLKKIQFRWADSLVSCGQKADSCKKIYPVSKFSGFVWTRPNLTSNDESLEFFLLTGKNSSDRRHHGCGETNL